MQSNTAEKMHRKAFFAQSEVYTGNKINFFPVGICFNSTNTHPDFLNATLCECVFYHKMIFKMIFRKV